VSSSPGLIVGVILSGVFTVVGLLARDDADVIVAVALALLAACAVATAVAMALPTPFHALGIDPACGSGPLATAIQDLLSILVYFTIAAAIAG